MSLTVRSPRPVHGSHHVRWVPMGVSIGIALLLQMLPVRTAPVPILEAVTTPAAGGLALAAVSPGALRSRTVRVNLYPLPTPGTTARGQEEDLELALFPDVVLTAVFDRFDTVQDSGTWVGTLAGFPLSSVTLAYRDGILSADINTGRASYAIRPLPDSSRPEDTDRPLHIVEEIDVSRLPGGPDMVEVPFDADAAPVLVPGAVADAGPVIDVMVVYTPAAQAHLGGAVAASNAIAMTVANTNAAYARSGVTQRIRLVHTALVPYTETATSRWGATHLTNLRLGVGGLAGVAALRDAYGADLVSIIYHGDSDVCGIANLSTDGVTANAAFGFSAVWTTCIAGRTFAHELGHNMGLLHDWFEPATGGMNWPMPFARGHIDLANRWITTMAYLDTCIAQGVGCQVINYFSNPDVEHDPVCADGSINCDLLRYWFFPRPRGFVGVPADGPTNCRPGIVAAAPCQADSRRALNHTAATVANYRQSR